MRHGAGVQPQQDQRGQRSVQYGGGAVQDPAGQQACRRAGGRAGGWVGHNPLVVVDSGADAWPLVLQKKKRGAPH